MRRFVATLLFALALAGCGAERAATPDPLRVHAPEGEVSLSYPTAGVKLTAPANWGRRRGELPRVATFSSGLAAVAVWAYARDEPIPRGREELVAARRRLVREVRRRDPRFRLERARGTRVAGAPAIGLLGEQAVAGQRLRTRSAHIFRGEAEYVVELLAPPGSFALADRGVMEPLLRSLSLSGRVRKP